jgi:hypothetical protein
MMYGSTNIKFALRNFMNAPKSFKLKLLRTLCVAVGLLSLPVTYKPHYVTLCNNNLRDHLTEIAGFTRFIDDRPPTFIAQTLQHYN